MERSVGLQQMRIIYGALLAAVPMYIVVGEKIARRRREPLELDVTLLAVLAALALGSGLSGFWFRQRCLVQARSCWQTDTKTALNRWRAGHLVMIACAEAVVLYGMITRVLGAGLRQAGLFYVAGLVLLGLAWPKPVVSAGDSFTGSQQI